MRPRSNVSRAARFSWPGRVARPPGHPLALLALLLSGFASPAGAETAERVIGVGGGVTEIVYALGAQQSLIGVDTSSTYPQAAQALPKVGYQRTLAAEGVLSLRPTLLLASHEAGPPAVLNQIEGAGVRVVRIDGDYTFDGLTERVRRVAEALHRSHDGRKLSEDLHEQWRVVQTRVRSHPPKNAAGKTMRVAFVMGRGAALLAAGRATGADALLRMAGAENAFGASFDNYTPLSAESLVAAAPDCIVVLSESPDTASIVKQVREAPGVALTPAGQSGRVAVLDIVLALGFGPRLPHAVQTLHETLMR